jgi:hypothetical protein
MRTVVLQGTEEEFSNLYQGVFDEDRVPQEVEPRVCLIDCFDKDTDSMSDEEFMKEAERRGTVYSLEGFQKAFNYGDIDMGLGDIIRIINVKV